MEEEKRHNHTEQGKDNNVAHHASLPTLRFALTVYDFSDHTQVLFEGSEAERFLGATAAALQHDAQLRVAVERKLAAIKATSLLLEYKMRVFVSKETVHLHLQTAVRSNKVNNNSSRDRDNAEHTYLR